MGPRSPRPTAALGVAALLLAACSLSVLETVSTRPRRAPPSSDGGAQIDAAPDVVPVDAPLELDVAPDAPLELDAPAPDATETSPPIDAPSELDAPPADGTPLDAPPELDAAPDAPDAIDAIDEVVPTEDVLLSDVVIGDVRLPEVRCFNNSSCPQGVCVRFDCNSLSPGICVPERLCRAFAAQVCGCDGTPGIDICSQPTFAPATSVVPRPCENTRDAGPPDVPVADSPVRDAFDCNAACPAKPNTTVDCTAGACGYTCVAGFGNCNGDSTDGCEVDLNTTPSHCGRCNVACGAGSECVRGSCVCRPGLMSCNGACVDPMSDAANCGMCGATCAAGDTCTDGHCACTPRWRCTNATALLCAPDGVQCEPGGNQYCRTVASCRLPPSGGERCWTCGIAAAGP